MNKKSSVLDDFFGDSETAVQECLYCGGTDGELEIAISDANGPTHWRHAECKPSHITTADANLPDFDRDTSVNGVE